MTTTPAETTAAATEAATATTTTTNQQQQQEEDEPQIDASRFGLGREKTLLDSVATEKSAVQAVLKGLTTAEQRQILDTVDPQMVIRHVRAEKGNIAKATTKLKRALAWRADFGVPALKRVGGDSDKTNGDNDSSAELTAIVARENATGKVYVRGHDRDGRAFVYMRPARENTNQELDNMRHLTWNLEKAIACTRQKSLEILKQQKQQQNYESNKSNENNEDDKPPQDSSTSIISTPSTTSTTSTSTVEQQQEQEQDQSLEKIILLIDYENFSLRNAPPMSTTKYTLDILQNMYPERMYRAYCLHPPFLFRTFWNMVRPFVDPVTKEKIVFVSNQAAEQLLIDTHFGGDRAKARDVLETVAGGTRKPADFDSQQYLQLPFAQAFE